MQTNAGSKSMQRVNLTNPRGRSRECGWQRLRSLFLLVALFIPAGWKYSPLVWCLFNSQFPPPISIHSTFPPPPPPHTNSQIWGSANLKEYLFCTKTLIWFPLIGASQEMALSGLLQQKVCILSCLYGEKVLGWWTFHFLPLHGEVCSSEREWGCDMTR